MVLRVKVVNLRRSKRLSLPRNSVVRLTDRPDMTIAVYRGCKATTQQHVFPELCPFFNLVHCKPMEPCEQNISRTSDARIVFFCRKTLPKVKMT